MVRKAYAGVDNKLFNNVSTAHLLNGLNDQRNADDKVTKTLKLWGAQ